MSEVPLQLSLGLADYSQVDTPGLRYKFVNAGAERPRHTKLVSANRLIQSATK